MTSHLASGSNVHECSDAPPNLFPASISHKTGTLGNVLAQSRTQGSTKKILLLMLYTCADQSVLHTTTTHT